MHPDLKPHVFHPLEEDLGGFRLEDEIAYPTFLSLQLPFPPSWLTAVLRLQRLNVAEVHFATSLAARVVMLDNG